MQDVPQEAVETRAAAEASPLPAKAPRKTVKQIREGKAKATKLCILADSLAKFASDVTSTMLVTREDSAKGQRCVELYKEVVAIYREIGGSREKLFTALVMLAKQSLVANCRHLTAMPYLEEAVAVSEDPKGGLKSWSIEFVKDVINARGMLANCYYKLGRYDEAAAIATRIVQACKEQDCGYQKRVLQDHLDALRRLASVCLMREDYAGVKEYCRQGMALVEPELVEADARGAQKDQDYSHYRLIFLGLLGSTAERQGDNVLADSYDCKIEQLAFKTESSELVLENGETFYTYDILILPTYRRRLRQALLEYERSRREDVFLGGVELMRRVGALYQQYNETLGQEGREPTMQCVAALRYAVQLTRSRVEHESAARLEARLDATEAYYRKMDQDLLEQLRRDQAATAGPGASGKAGKSGKKKSKKRRNKAKQRAEEESAAAAAALVRLTIADGTPEEEATTGASGTSPDLVQSLGCAAKGLQQTVEGQDAERGGGSQMEEEEEKEECAVCLQDLTDCGGPGPAILCGHVFHGHCLQGWVDRCKLNGYHLTCPYCMQPLLWCEHKVN